MNYCGSESVFPEVNRIIVDDADPELERVPSNITRGSASGSDLGDTVLYFAATIAIASCRPLCYPGPGATMNRKDPSGQARVYRPPVLVPILKGGEYGGS